MKRMRHASHPGRQAARRMAECAAVGERHTIGSMCQRATSELPDAFDYLETRLTDTCEPRYHCAEMYNTLKLARAFNPNYAATSLDMQGVGALIGIKPLAGLNYIPALQREAAAYLTAAQQAAAYLPNPAPCPFASLAYPCGSLPGTHL